MSIWLIETLLASTLLMALVMLLRGPVARHFGPHVAYALWLLPALRMVLPPLPSNSAAAAVLPVSGFEQAGLTIIYPPASAAVTQGAATAFPWLEAGVALWLAGSLIFMLVQAIGYWRFRSLLLRDGELIDYHGGIAVAQSERAQGPLAFGLLRRFVVLPVDFELRYDADERELALAHEIAHHRRGDLIANGFALLALGLHWCNPVAWIAYRAFRADQESACDARVLRQDMQHPLGPRRQAYGRAILKAASSRSFVGACHLNSIDHLKGRLKMLSRKDQSAARISWGMAAVAVATFSGLALTASGSRAAEEVATVTHGIADARLTKLVKLLPESVKFADSADRAEPAAVPAVPQVPAEPDAPAAPAAPRAPEAPLAPTAPLSAMAPPSPPSPPTPPSARSEARSQVITSADGRRRVIVRHRDGDVDEADIPSEAEIAAMIPEIDVRESCGEGHEMVRTDSTTSSEGKRERIVVRMCSREIARQSREAAQQGRAAALAGRRAALAGMKQARAAIAGEMELSEAQRVRALANLDRQIARMEAETN